MILVKGTSTIGPLSGTCFSNSPALKYRQLATDTDLILDVVRENTGLDSGYASAGACRLIN